MEIIVTPALQISGADAHGLIQRVVTASGCTAWTWGHGARALTSEGAFEAVQRQRLTSARATIAAPWTRPSQPQAGHTHSMATPTAAREECVRQVRRQQQRQHQRQHHRRQVHRAELHRPQLNQHQALRRAEEVRRQNRRRQLSRSRYSAAIVCPLVHTPDEAVHAAIDLCRLTPADVLLDVGCGDGRVLLAAAARGAHAIGIDVDRKCLAKSRAAADRIGLSHLIDVSEHDFMHFEEHAAYERISVLFLFLTRRLIEQLGPGLRRAVRAGKRVVIYCPSGCTHSPSGSEVCEPRSETHRQPHANHQRAGNSLGYMPHASSAMLGMLRLYEQAATTTKARAPVGTTAVSAPASEDQAVTPSSSSSSSPNLQGGSFEDGAPGAMHADFVAAAARLPPVLRRVLEDDVVDEDGGAALVALLGGSQGVPHTRLVVRRTGAISPEGCAALRQAVDAERDVTRDSVDRLAQHQLNISVERLIELTSRSEVEALWRLADEVLSLQRQEADARAEASGEAVPVETAEATESAQGGFRVNLFVRRYTRESRPWIGFHQDISGVTLNVALSDDNSHGGGRLHALVGGRHIIITREEGEVTAHSDDIMHAVSMMRHGVRHSLIAFFYVLRDDESSVEYQTIPRRELYPQSD